MAGGFGQYIRDTRGELRHVAWPTRMQTTVYTLLVIAISLGVAAYLGFFDFLFTGALGRVINVLPQGSGIQITQQPAANANALMISSSTTPQK